jgi:ABC-type sugar transport system substrate-binding protein
MNDKTTLTDIANVLGVSVATVHRALTGQGRINESTKQMIISKASEMNYTTKIETSAKKKLNLAFLCPDNFFYQEIISGAKVSTDEYRVFGLNTHFLLSKDYSAQAQIDQLNEILKNGRYDGIVVSPIHTMLLNPLIQNLADRNIPTVTVNNDISSSCRVCFVGEDSYMSGQMAAELYSNILSEHSKIAMMQSLVSAEGLKKRIDGFGDFIRNDKRMDLLGIYDFYDNIENAFETSKQIIVNTDAKGIYVNSMIGTIGVLRAIKELNPEKPPFIIGYDFNDEIKECIKSNLMFGTLLQSPYRQGYYAVKVLYKILSNGMHKFKTDTLNTPSQLIIKSNLRQIKNDHSLELDSWLYTGNLDE